MAAVYVGTSGYNYRHWRSLFYPADLPVKRWLAYASRQFNSIELNGTFYSLKSPGIFKRWVEETPDDFLFAVKGSRFITHNLKLQRARPALANFYASGVLALDTKTGPFLWQLPATYRYNAERIEAFCRLLPRDSAAASRLARKHDDRLRKGALLTSKVRVPYRHAFEVRHPSFFTRSFYDQLASHGYALVLADTAGKFPYAEELTADFVYIRLHGSQAIYASAYSDDELAEWARRIKRWKRRRDVYVYFDNDAMAEAPHDARRLAKLVG